MNDSLIDREPEVEQALERINVRWNGQRTEQALASLQQRMRRRALATRAGIGVVGVAAFAWLLAPRVSEMFRSKSEPRAEQIVVPSERPPVTFYDGSQMTPLDQQTEVSVLEASPDRIVAGVLRGGARFEVTHRPSRVFLAQAGGVSVEALGTIFSIERLDPGVWVSVTRGHVRVQWEGGSRELAVGEADWFPPRAEGAGGVAAIRPENLPPGDAREAGASPNPTSTISDLVRSDRWKALAKQGKNDEAYTMLAPLPSNQVRDPEELLLAADVARLSGHPKQAVPFLERVLTQFSKDSRASVAAFSLGRILMTSLGSPAKAAARFAQVRSLAPRGSLAEDALAREVEAWSLSGQQDRARERAQEFLRLYPSGQRAMAVRKFGGVD